MLDGIPGRDDAAGYQMAPADGGLIDGKLVINLGIVGKFEMRRTAGVEVRPDAC